MKTVKSKTTYEVHGREFSSAAKAAEFEKLVAAKQAFEDARNALGKLLAESFTTADGEAFRFARWTYYHIFTPYNSVPRLFEVSFLYWSWNFESFEHGDETDLVLFTSHDPWGNKCDREHGYPIRELYASREKAEAALRLAKRDWLVEQLDDLDEEVKPCS